MTTALGIRIKMFNSIMDEIYDRIESAAINNNSTKTWVKIPSEVEELVVASLRDKGYTVNWVADHQFSHEVSWALNDELKSGLESHFLS